MDKIRLGFLASAGGWHVNDLERAARAASVEGLRLSFTQLAATLQPPRLQAGLHDARSLDSLLVRSMPSGSLEQVIFRMDWLQRLEADGIPVVNAPRVLETCIDKYLSCARLEAAGLPIPATAACEDASTATQAFHDLGGDVVIKPLFGSEGRGLERVSSLEAAVVRFPELAAQGRVFYLQRFVEHPGYDYRVFVLGGCARWCMRRHAVDDWRTNLACGGKAEAVSATSDLTTLAVNATRALGADIAGVDLLPDADGKLWVLEVNAVPGWRALAQVCRTDIAAEIVNYIKVHASSSRQESRL